MPDDFWGGHEQGKAGLQWDGKSNLAGYNMGRELWQRSNPPPASQPSATYTPPTNTPPPDEPPATGVFAVIGLILNLIILGFFALIVLAVFLH